MVNINEVYSISEMLLDGELSTKEGYLSYGELKIICNNDIELANTVILDLQDRGLIQLGINQYNKTILVRI